MYSTTDLSLAAYLSLGLPVLDLNRADPRRVAFEFEDTPDLRSAITSFNSGKSVVEPKKYFNALRDLKNRLYATTTANAPGIYK